MAILGDEGNLQARYCAHPGPASYVTIATTGDTLQASEAALKNFVYAEGAVTQSGTYIVRVIGLNAAGPLGGMQSSVKLEWIVVATGSEVAPGTNLSAESVVMRVVGN